jgi:CubicO group peptidase (beta-lactamase class C family)
LTSGGLSAARLGRMREVMAGFVERGEMPGLVTLVHRRGETHVEAYGALTFGGAPMRRDTIFRIASLTKPVAAAAAMILVEECRLRLDEPAKRPISLRDLLTLRMGLGHIMEPGDDPIRRALKELDLLQGPPHPRALPGTDEWIRRVGTLPLVHQPGERWMYDLGTDVLGVLIARAAGQSFEAFLRERLFEPLGMKDTAFSVPAEKLGRLAGCYQTDPETGKLRVYDDPADSEWSQPPAFESGSGGLVSTVDDYLAFCRMMLDKGRYGSERILSRSSVELMTMDHLTPEQKVEAEIFFGDRAGWGFGMGVVTRRTDLAEVPGAFGWTGGLGTSAQSDPGEDLVGILMTQRLMDSPQMPHAFLDFWTSVYQAIDD